MGLVVITPPAAGLSVVSLASLKSYLLIDQSDSDDLLSELLAEASAWVETETATQMLTATKRLYLDRFPLGISDYGFGLGPGGNDVPIPLATMTGLVINQCDAREIRLKTPPLQSVSSVNYLINGTPTVLSTSAYTVDAASLPGRIVLNDGQAWPKTDAVANAVWVDFVCGFGAPSAVPRAYATCIRWFAAHLNQNRLPASEAKLNELPYGLKSMIETLMFREAYAA